MDANPSPRTIEATFEITGWEETPYDEPSEGPKLTQVTVSKRYHGPLEGTGVARVLTTQGADGQAYVASERVEGVLEGRRGSFVVQHGGTADSSGQRTFGQIVPGSGTGELRGMRGEAVEAQQQVLTLVLAA
jgi:Protein of unknown function (DUF3224)